MATNDSSKATRQSTATIQKADAEIIATHLESLLEDNLKSTDDEKRRVGLKLLLAVLQVPLEYHSDYNEILFDCIKCFLNNSSQHFQDDEIKSLLEYAAVSKALTSEQHQFILEDISTRELSLVGKSPNLQQQQQQQHVSSQEEVNRNTRGNAKVRNRGNRVNGKPAQCRQSAPLFGREYLSNIPKSAPSEPHQQSRRAGNNRGSSNSRVIGKRPSRGFDDTNGYDDMSNVDLSQYQCFNCNEFGHIARGCSRQTVYDKRGRGGYKMKARGAPKHFQTNNHGERAYAYLNPATSDDDESSVSSNDDETVSSTTSTDEILSDKSAKRKQQKRNKPNYPSILNNTLIRKIHYLTLKFTTGKNIADKNENDLPALIECIKNMNKQQYNEQNESLSFNMLVHIAQNDHVYNNEQCTELFHLIYDKNVLIKDEYYRKLIKFFIDNGRQKFCRQRPLIPLNDINIHVHNSTETKRMMLNDIQEYLLRSDGSIDQLLYEILKEFITKNLNLDNLFYNRICHLIFNTKKNLFNEQQTNELTECVRTREKRLERNNKRSNWLKRLAGMKNQQVNEDIDQLLNDLEQMLNEITSRSSQSEKNKEKSQYILNYYRWYDSILLLASCGHLNAEQYKRLLTIGIESTIFNAIQKCYMNHYLIKGRAPVTLQELNDMQSKLQNKQQQSDVDADCNDKEQAFIQIKQILSIEKPLCSEVQTTTEKTSVNEQDNVTDSTSLKPESLISDNEKKKEQNRSSNQTTNNNYESENKIPFLNSYITSRLISLIESICSDVQTFSMEQCKELLDFTLKTSTLLEPMARNENEKLQSFYLRPVSVDELLPICTKLVDMSTSVNNKDVFNEFKTLVQKRVFTFPNSLDLLTNTLIQIYQNKTKYSNEQCKQLKNIIEKKHLNKKRNKKLSKAFQLARSNESPTSFQQAPSQGQQHKEKTTLKTQYNTNFIPLNSIILNRLFTNIMLHDQRAYQEFLKIIEQLPKTMSTTPRNSTIELNYCLITAIILYIKQHNSDNSIDQTTFDQTKLNQILKHNQTYFSTFISEQQQRYIFSNLTVTTSNQIDVLISNLTQGKGDMKTVLSSVETIKTKTDLQKVLSFIIYTFENDNQHQLYTESNIADLIKLVKHHPLCDQSGKNTLEYLNDLLEKHHLHLSPKQIMKQLEDITDDKQYDLILINIQHMLELPSSIYTISEWKKAMVRVLKHCFTNKNKLLINDAQIDNLKQIAKSSPMLSQKLFQTQLMSEWKTSVKDNEQKKEISSTQTSLSNENTNEHTELFFKLETSDPLLNENAVTQLRLILENEQLPLTISIKKYISALNYLFKHSEKFSISSHIDQWLNLVANNRKKLFDDQQCDELLITLIFLKLNLINHNLLSINHLIKSRNRLECIEGLNLFGKLLEYNNPQYLCKTLGEQLFAMIRNVAYNERFNTDNVKKALKYGQNCQHLSDIQREKLQSLI